MRRAIDRQSSFLWSSWPSPRHLPERCGHRGARNRASTFPRHMGLPPRSASFPRGATGAGRRRWQSIATAGVYGCSSAAAALVVRTRTCRPILHFDPSGKLLASFGAGMFVFPHGITVDPEGNVWVADADGKNGKGHQVVKFSPDGKMLMTLGKAGMPGDAPGYFNRPSGVAIARNGDIFVADGHGGDSNARVVKFSKTGEFITTWGKKGTAAGEFDTPHAIAVDSQERVYVADRSNDRVQVFDANGKFLTEWKQFGRPSGVYVDANDVIYVADFADRGQGGLHHGPRLPPRHPHR